MVNTKSPVLLAQRKRVHRLLFELGVGPGHPLSIPEIARRLGVHRSHLSKIMYGERHAVTENGRWKSWSEFEADIRKAVEPI